MTATVILVSQRDGRQERGDETRLRMLDVGERLIAEHGINGVSLRQIGIEAGCANTSALQYHFGGKTGLINAILTRRREGLEVRRAQLIEQAPLKGLAAVARAVLEVLFLPIAEAVDAEGRHSYAAFLLQLTGLAALNSGYNILPLSSASHGAEAVRRLANLRPELGSQLLARRVMRLYQMFLAALLERDRADANGENLDPLSVYLDEIFTTMTWAVLAPSGQGSGSDAEPGSLT